MTLAPALMANDAHVCRKSCSLTPSPAGWRVERCIRVLLMPDVTGVAEDFDWEVIGEQAQALRLPGDDRPSLLLSTSWGNGEIRLRAGTSH